MESQLLNLLSTREHHTRFSPFIKEHTVSSEGSYVLKQMGDFLEAHPTADGVHWDKFKMWLFTVAAPTMKADRIKLLTAYIDTLKEEEDVDPDDWAAIIDSFIERDYATRIADVSMAIAEGGCKETLQDVSDLCDAYRKELDKVDEVEACIVNDDLHSILEKTTKGSGLLWRLNELNLSLGPIRKGDLIVFGARPDTGKTTMLASECTNMAPQMEPGKCVVWFNNEEEGRKVKFRIIQAMFGVDRRKIEADPGKYWEEYKDMMGGADRIKLVDKATLSVRDAEQVLKRVDAGLIIFDQLWKVHGFEKESAGEVARQQMLFAWSREIAKGHAPVIVVHQADASAEGERWIEMNQLYGSKTGIQGEADAIVTLGRTHEPGYEHSRFLYVPKNKLYGEDESMRNGKFEITIIPAHARFKGTL